MLAPSTVEGECARAPFTNLFQAVVYSEEVRRSHPETQQVKVLRSGRDAAQIFMAEGSGGNLNLRQSAFYRELRLYTLSDKSVESDSKRS